MAKSSIKVSKSNKTYNRLTDRCREIALLNSSAAVLGWDERTYMPAGGAQLRADQLGLLARMVHEQFVAPEIGEWLSELEQSAIVKDNGSVEAANVREMVKAGGARSIRQERFTGKELAKQIQAMAQKPATLATAAHAAWNCGRPKATEDLADLVESFGGASIQDVIRVGGESRQQVRETFAPGGAG